MFREIKKSKKTKNKKGFTLIEVLMAIFIFALMASAASGVFIKMIQSYRYAKAAQKDLENAQYAMNLITKTLRTSSIAKCQSGEFSTEACPTSENNEWIRVYDHSRGVCRMYSFNNDRLEERVPGTGTNADSPGEDISRCGGGDYLGADESKSLTTGTVSGEFDVVASSDDAGSEEVGKVTISMTINSGDKDTHIQSTVSLRDYSEAGI